MSVIRNKDIKIMVDVEELLHSKIDNKNDYEYGIWCNYWNLVERFISHKKEVAKKQINWNKNNKEYHRITNNISNNKIRGNKEKEEYWRNKLKEFKENDS